MSWSSFPNFLVFFVILSTFNNAGSENSSATLLHRQKRFLYFPSGGTFKLVLGFAVPIKLGLKQSMAWGLNFQFQYALPPTTNDTQTYPPIVGRERSKRDLPSDRTLFYQGIEKILNSNGLNGRACLLRSICENAMYSTHHETNGLYGQLLHIALTPDYGAEMEQTKEIAVASSDLDSVYLDAKKAGEYGVECTSLYPECAQGPLDMISLLDDGI